MSKLKEIFGPLAAKATPVAFVIKGSPDPDAIASSLALLSFYQSIGGEGTIYHEDHISHSSNKMMINVLDINLAELKLEKVQEEFYVICDHADPNIGLDMAKCILHVDHHKDSAGDWDHAQEEIIELDSGSCSSIIVRLLCEEDFFANTPSAQQIATALAYGIKTDTDNLDSAREKDWDAMKTLSQYCNQDNLKKITSSRIPPQTIKVLKAALAAEKQESNWLYASAGFLQDTYRDSIALVADEMIRRQGVDHVLVYAIIEKEEGTSIQGSVRSIDAGFDMEGFVKSFSDNAGGRKYKGGFEIPLGFLATCENRELLEEITTTTVEGRINTILSTTKKKEKKA